MIKRRSFIKSIATAGVLSSLGGLSNVLTARPIPDGGLGWLSSPVNPNRRVLVVVRLFGGNDGLNTLVPVHDSEYYRLRRDLALVDLSVAAEKTIEIPGYSHVRFHPAMQGLAQLNNEGKMAIVQGVGYPNMDLSHFRGTNIWLSASDSDVFQLDGWMGRFLEARLDANTLELDAPFAVEIGPRLGRAFDGKRKAMGFAYAESSGIPDAIGPTDPTSAAADLEEILAAYEDQGERHIRSISRAFSSTQVDTSNYYVNGGNMAPGLQAISQCIRGNLPTPMYILHTGEFDTHHYQTVVHHQQLDELSTNIFAFQRELENAGVADRVTTLIISEFGRRPDTNNSGTDHGTAAPVFLVGTSLLPGLHGVSPSTTDLDADGNLHWHVDFRSIYASILEQWFGSDSSFYLPNVLQRAYPTIPLFNPIPQPDSFDYSPSEPLAWPNPCSSMVRITLSDRFEGLVRTTIVTTNGIPVRVYDAQCVRGTIELDISSISQGAYLAMVASGSRNGVVPIVIRR